MGASTFKAHTNAEPLGEAYRLPGGGPRRALYDAAHQLVGERSMSDIFGCFSFRRLQEDEGAGVLTELLIRMRLFK